MNTFFLKFIKTFGLGVMCIALICACTPGFKASSSFAKDRQAALAAGHVFAGTTSSCQPTDGPQNPGSCTTPPAPPKTTPTPAPNCTALLPSWASAPAPALAVMKTADAASGILPAIQPNLVIGPFHKTASASAGGPTLATSTQGVYAALLLCSSTCTVVQKWDAPQANIDLAQRVYHGQAFQLTASAPLAAGSYYVALFPTGAPTDAEGFWNAGSSIGPMMDSVVNFMGSETFTVDSSGQISASPSINILLDVSYASASPFEASPTLPCTQGTATGSIDPLMIDFSGSGISLSSQYKGINFDLNGDGKPEKVSWPVNSMNMFLVHDKTGTGSISGADFFGNTTPGPDGNVAKDGFAALAKYDINNDGLIDDRDPVFSQLRLWSDANRDGVVQKGELKTLSEMGIISIELKAVSVHEIDTYGNQTTLRAFVHRVNGLDRMISDVWFMPQWH